MPNQDPDRDIPGMIFSREGKAAAIRDTYQEIAAEVESLAQLAGGTEPDDDLSDAIAFLARAMGSLTNAHRVALQEWAADGGDACFSEGELDKLLGALGKIAREEKAAAEPDLVTRVYGHMGYDRVAPVILAEEMLPSGSVEGEVDALLEMIGDAPIGAPAPCKARKEPTDDAH